jgi:type IV pilus assembly protein PilE
MRREPQRAFTLTELMIVISVLALLVAVAYPSYVEQVRKMRRSDAKQSLLHTAQQLERCYSQFRSYASTGCPQVAAGPKVDLASRDGFYRITSQTLAPDSFVLLATPQGPQAGDTRCAQFRLTNAEVRFAQDASANNTTDDCW